ncbi:hypothetical protein Tco_1498992 [Tanacetum coccineum]
MLVIKRFRERKKIFRERKLSENFMLRGVIFCKEWSSIYRQENPTVTGAVPAVLDISGGRQAYKGAAQGSGGESFWEEGDDFGVDVLRFHTCPTDILGNLEKLEWWFEQDIDDEGEEDEEDGGGDEV